MEIIEENKKEILIALGIIGLVIIFLVIRGCTKKDNTIHTIKSFKDSELPYINLKIDGVNIINNRLQDDYYNIKNRDNGSTMKYEYSKNGDILSLLVIETYEEFEEDDKPALVDYITYNIDLKNKKILTDDDIYTKYNINKTTVENTISNALSEQFNKDLNNGFITEYNCNLEENKMVDDCRLDYYIERYRRYYGIDENLTLYVKNNKVYGYLNIYEQLPYTTRKNYSNMNVEFKLN